MWPMVMLPHLREISLNEGTIKERWKDYFSKLFTEGGEGGETGGMLGHLSNSEEDKKLHVP